MRAYGQIKKNSPGGRTKNNDLSTDEFRKILRAGNIRNIIKRAHFCNLKFESAIFIPGRAEKRRAGKLQVQKLLDFL